MNWRWIPLTLGYLLLGFMIATVEAPAETITVSASAYNTIASQTQGNPNVGACGRLSPSQPSIAVSRDLRKKLPCNSKVKIEGKIYSVRDTMGSRWKQKIDICYFKDVKGARNFGLKRNVKMEIINGKS